uniref:Flagellar biosynthetic protein FliQ n=1 Tax=Mesoaciditoga lauensis TaxID=1495039 RepID=A0A7V3VTH7_9BACT
MTSDVFVDILKQGIYLFLIVVSPALIVSLIVGLIISVFQAITQINEQTLTFVPKILAVFLTLAIIFPWMIQKVIDYTQLLWTYYISLI